MERSPDLLQPVFAAVRKWIHNPALNVGYSIEAPDEPTHQFSNKGRFGKTTACSSFCGGLTAKPAVRKNVLPAFTAVAAATVLLARVPTCDGACLGTGTTLAKEAWRARPFFWQVASCAPTARSVAPRWATTSRHVVRRMLAVRGRWRAGRPRRAATCFRRWPVGFSVGPMGGDAPRSSGPRRAKRLLSGAQQTPGRLRIDTLSQRAAVGSNLLFRPVVSAMLTPHGHPRIRRAPPGPL